MRWFNRNLPELVMELAAGEKVLGYTNTNFGYLVATQSGLVSHKVKIAWPQLFQASFDQSILTFSYEQDAKSQQLTFELDPKTKPNEFAALVRAKVTTNVVAQVRLEYQPAQFVIISARKDIDSAIKIVVTPDADIDIASENFKIWVNHQVSEFNQTFGF